MNLFACEELSAGKDTRPSSTDDNKEFTQMTESSFTWLLSTLRRYFPKINNKNIN